MILRFVCRLMYHPMRRIMAHTSPPSLRSGDDAKGPLSLIFLPHLIIETGVAQHVGPMDGVATPGIMHKGVVIKAIWINGIGASIKHVVVQHHGIACGALDELSLLVHHVACVASNNVRHKHHQQDERQDAHCDTSRDKEDATCHGCGNTVIRGNNVIAAITRDVVGTRISHGCVCMCT